MKCDCGERIEIEINSMKLFEELKKFFDEQKKVGIFEGGAFGVCAQE